MHDLQEGSTVAAELGFPERAPVAEGLVPDASNIVVTLRTDTKAGQQIASLVAELGLSEHLHSAEGLKAELQKIIFALHPDKTGGAFQSERDEGRFLKARRVVELLDAGPPAEDGAANASLPAAPRAIPDGRAPVPPSRALHRLHLRALTHARERIAEHFAGPKIASAGLAAVTLLLVLLADRFEANPLLRPLLTGPGMSNVLLLLAPACALALVAFWWLERSAKARADHLFSEAALGDIFDQARLCARKHGRIGKLSAWDIRRGVEVLLDGRRERPLRLARWTFLGALDPVTLETIASIQMQRLIERNVLSELKTASVELLYEVSPHAMAS
ncbi:MAG: hypothetical protein ABI409_06555 [Ramlibacter sp.]